MRLRAQRRGALPNMAASLHSDSSLPAFMLGRYAATAAISTVGAEGVRCVEAPRQG
jgi:hypothetical protein